MIRVTHTIGDLERDCARIPVKAAPRMVKVVRKNVEQGNKVAQGIARRKSGTHGTAYYKRLSAEMTSPLSGEYGPHGDVVGNAVGAGWRHGPPNTDLQKSADLQGPKFAHDAGTIFNGLFW